MRQSACGLTGGAVQANPGVECAGDRPGLGRAAARRVRLSAVEDFGDRAQTGVEEMVANRFEAFQRAFRIAVDPVFGQRVVSEQPRPNRPLVIGTVTLPDAARVVRWRGRARCRRARGTIDPLARHGFEGHTTDVDDER